MRRIRLRRALCASAAGTAALVWSGSALALPATQPLRTWAPNGPVTAVAAGDGVAYLAGSFTRLVPPPSTFAVLRDGGVEAMPLVDAPVRAIEPDGAGGWVLLTMARDPATSFPAASVVRVAANGSVALQGRPGGASYIAGGLAVAGSMAIAVRGPGPVSGRAFGIDLATGAETDWRSPPVRSVLGIAAADDLVAMAAYPLGDGPPESRLVLGLDPGSGALRWSTSVSGTGSLDLAVSAGRVYLAGSFAEVAGAPRAGVAALDAATGALLDWQPSLACPRGEAARIAASPSRVLVGCGVLQVIQADPTSGEAAWVQGSGWDSVAVAGDRAYAASVYTKRIVEIDAAGATTELGPLEVGWVDTLAAAGDRLAVGGRLLAFGGIPSSGLGAIDLATGEPTGWDPRPEGDVRALTRVGATVYVGGGFTAIGGTPRAHLAAVDARSGAVLDWGPAVDGPVDQILVDGDVLYLAGSFTAVGGRPRHLVTAVDRRSGRVLAWSPRLGSQASEIGLAPAPDGLLVFGVFPRIDGVQRPGIALLSRTGVVLPWKPSRPVARAVSAAAVDEGRTFVAWMTSNGRGGSPLDRLQVFDDRGNRLADRGYRTPFEPMLRTGAAVYLGDRTIRARSRAWSAPVLSIDALGEVRDAYVQAIAANRRFLLLGGNWDRVGGVPQPFFAIFPALPGTRP